MNIDSLTIKNLTDNSSKIFKCKNIGIEDINCFKHNYNEIINLRSNCAREHKFHLEFISLKIQLLDLWLRIFYINTKEESEPDIKPKYASLGSMIELCKRKLIILGKEELLIKLKEFNLGRRNAIHYYLLGRDSYDSLEKYIYNSTFILKDLIEFVYNSCGTSVINKDIDLNIEV